MKTYNIYCDESCHLKNDPHQYMLIAYVKSSYPQVKVHHENIKNLKKKHHFENEIKWSSVSKSKHLFYMDLIDYFFTNDLEFRAIVIEKENIKTKNIKEFDEFYYKMYYQLLHHKMNMDCTYNVYMDIKDTLSAEKVRTLKKILNVNYANIRTLQNIRSDESLLMQLTDLLMGAISYHLRQLDQKNNVIAKKKIIEKILLLSEVPLTKSTFKNNDKFNLFFIDLKA
jgi:hypothetical protein